MDKIKTEFLRENADVVTVIEKENLVVKAAIEWQSARSFDWANTAARDLRAEAIDRLAAAEAALSDAVRKMKL